MQEVWARFMCWIGWHNLELEFWSAPGVFSIGDKEVEIRGNVHRCLRCETLFFTYKDWPMVACVEVSRPRPGAMLELKEARVFAAA